MDAGVLLIGTVLFWILCCGIAAWIDTRVKKAQEARKRTQEIHAENCRLRVEVERVKQREEFVVDMVRSELAIKDLLLRQKWRDATNGKSSVC